MKFILLSFLLLNYSIAKDKIGPEVITTEAKNAKEDIKKQFGIVPSFLNSYPDYALAPLWEEYKAVQVNTATALGGKLKQLISLAIAAQIPSTECTYVGREFAKLNGANQAEMEEAVAISAATRHWSTYLNGLIFDQDDFRKETTKMMNNIRDNMNKKKEVSYVEVTDAQSAYKDIKQTFGLIPTFIKVFPEVAVAGAWKSMKAIQLNSQTALSPKEKELIGLAVSAQIPCHYCAFFHTEAAKLNGATQKEITEAVVVASVTRQWSTLLHGRDIDEGKFRKEVDQAIKYIKSHSTKNLGMTQSDIEDAGNEE